MLVIGVSVTRRVLNRHRSAIVGSVTVSAFHFVSKDVIKNGCYKCATLMNDTRGNVNKF